MNGNAGSRGLITGLMRPWWRLTRGLTLGAQGVVIDARSRVLLVRHGYRPGWHFPGGGVERGETIETALSRELEEETGVIVEDRPALHGLFANGDNFPGDHVAVFIVREWTQPSVPAPNAEIAEQGFFDIAKLPGRTDAGARRRLEEVFGKAEVSERW
jgi:ADP-ribose pyrophosphatase YjhB (NUDIX family)